MDRRIVFPDVAEMQAVAREMNCSETTFLLPPTRPECAARVRIFTPARELPFAGHPTIGTAWVLATEKLLPQDCRRFNLEEGIGPVEVTLEGDPVRPTRLWMRHGEARFGPELTERAGFARALGLTEADLLPGAPVCTGSTLYVAATDLMPEANRESGARMAFMVFAGVAFFYAMKTLIGH